MLKFDMKMRFDINFLYVHVLPISDIHVVPITWNFFPGEARCGKKIISDLDDILLIDALTAAEYEFYDTIRIKIGYDKGYEFGLLYNNKLESNILM